MIKLECEIYDHVKVPYVIFRGKEFSFSVMYSATNGKLMMNIIGGKNQQERGKTFFGCQTKTFKSVDKLVEFFNKFEMPDVSNIIRQTFIKDRI